MYFSLLFETRCLNVLSGESDAPRKPQLVHRQKSSPVGAPLVFIGKLLLKTEVPGSYYDYTH